MTALFLVGSAAFLGGWRYGLWCAAQRIARMQAMAKRDRALAALRFPAPTVTTAYARWQSWN